MLIILSASWGVGGAREVYTSASQMVRQELWVRHKYSTGEVLHETCINKLGWTFAGSMGRAQVWSVAGVFELKLVCKEAGNH